MMPFMGPLSHNPHDLFKLTAMSKSRGTDEQLRELSNLKKAHDRCIARVRTLERSNGSEEDKREIQRLHQVISSLNKSWNERVQKIEEQHQKELQEWIASSENGVWEEKYNELLGKYNKEKSRLEELKKLQDDGSNDSNDSEKIQNLEREIDSCTRSKGEIEDKYTKQVRDLMIEISKLSSTGGNPRGGNPGGGNPRGGNPGGDNQGNSGELKACLASKKDLENRLLLLTNGDKSTEHLNIYIRKYGVLTPSDFIDTNTIEGIDELETKRRVITSWSSLNDRIKSNRVVKNSLIYKRGQQVLKSGGINEIDQLILRKKGEQQKEGISASPDIWNSAEHDHLHETILTTETHLWDDETVNYFKVMYTLESRVVRGMNGVLSMILKHQEYLKSLPQGTETNVTSLTGKFTGNEEDKIFSVPMDEWDQDTTEYFHTMFASELEGLAERDTENGIRNIKVALEAFTGEQMVNDDTFGLNLLDVSEKVGETIASTQYDRARNSLRYVIHMSSSFMKLVTEAFQTFVPEDIDGTYEGGDKGDIKLVTMFATRMMEANPGVKNIADMFDMVIEMRSSSEMKLILRSILNGDTSKKVSNALRRMTTSEKYKILVFPFMERDINSDLAKNQERWEPIRDNHNTMARQLIGGKVLNISIPPPTMRYTFDQIKGTDQIFIGDDNPLDNIDDDTVSKLVTGVFDYNKSNSRRFPVLVAPVAPFEVTRGFSEEKHGDVHRKAHIYITERMVFETTIRILSDQFDKKIAPSIRKAVVGGVYIDETQDGETVKILNAEKFDPKIIERNLLKPENVGEFVEKHSEFAKSYSEKNPDVTKFNELFPARWTTLVDKYRKLQCCVEYFKIEPMILSHMAVNVNPERYDSITLKEVIQEISSRLADIQDVVKQYNTCSDIQTIVANTGVFGKPWGVDIPKGLVEKMKRATVTKNSQKVRRYTDQQIQRFVFPPLEVPKAPPLPPLTTNGPRLPPPPPPPPPVPSGGIPTKPKNPARPGLDFSEGKNPFADAKLKPAADRDNAGNDTRDSPVASRTRAQNAGNDTRDSPVARRTRAQNVVDARQRSMGIQLSDGEN